MGGQECKAHALSIAFNSNSLDDYRGPRAARDLGRKQRLPARSQCMDMEASSPGLSGTPGGDRF